MHFLITASIESQESQSYYYACDCLEIVLKSHVIVIFLLNMYVSQYFFSVLSRFDESVMLNMDILPKLNYVPMIWNHHNTGDSGSVADMTSVVSAVNAAAVKYLSDQQLVQQAVAAAGGKSRGSSARSAQRSQQPTTLSNASMYGIKSANLSLASMNYFQKHRLGNNRAHPTVSEPQSAMPSQTSESKMEDLLNSITAQVNRLQMTMSPKHSTQQNAVTGGSGDYVNNNVHFSRRQSDLSNDSLFANEISETLPTRQHVRKSFDGSVLSDTPLDETYISKRHHLLHCQASVDGGKQNHRHASASAT